MSVSAKVTSKCQITLPAKLRAALGIKPGDRVEFRLNESGNFEIVAKTETLADLRGSVELEKPITTHELESWIDDARAARESITDE